MEKRVAPKQPSTLTREEERTLDICLCPKQFYASNFYNNAISSDITIKVGDRTIHGHQLILRQIPYFDKLFSAGMQDSREVVLKDISLFNAEHLLRFAYGRPLPRLPFEEVVALLCYYRYVSVETRVTFIRLAALDENPWGWTHATDFSVEVLSELSFAEMEFGLRKCIPKDSPYRWKAVFMWISTHRDASDAVHIKFLSLMGPPVFTTVLSSSQTPKNPFMFGASRLSAPVSVHPVPITNSTPTDLEVFASYREVPVLCPYIIEELLSRQLIPKSPLNKDRADTPSKKRPLPDSYQEVQEKIAKLESPEVQPPTNEPPSQTGQPSGPQQSGQ